MPKKFLLTAVAVCLSFTTLTDLVNGKENTGKRSGRAERKLDITVVPWGPTQADVDAATLRVERTETVTRQLGSSKFRQIGFEYLYDTVESKNQPSRPPTRFRVVYYNYSTDMTLLAEGDFVGDSAISTHWVNAVPGVGEEEINAAYRVIELDSTYSALRRANKVEFYAAMPPTTVVEGERLVNIGIRNPETGENEIVGVSFKNDKVVKYANNAPPTSAATPDACGIANAGQSPTGQGLAGQYTLTVTEAGGSPLWEMLVLRPSASSGANFEKSGLEIRDVKYRGKSVLKRGHVPVLNVNYVSSCGPFRDWQYSEGFFNAPSAGATDPAPAIRILAAGQVATTSVETRNDTGNFRGVAIYTQDVGFGPEVVMVTEMEAGWYRYIMEWRFGADGTIRPRYGFGSVADSCVCVQRTHHVYWRFDFDIVNASNRIYQLERGHKFIKSVDTETALFKSVQKNRSLLIQNALGDEAYQLVPGTNDGAVLNATGDLVDSFGVGDFWLMQFKGTAASPNEVDDPNSGPAANLAPFLNGESLLNQDIVVWYAAHQTRSDDLSRNMARSPEVITGNHIVGPVLRPVRW
ncbi:MAG: hypothetical protein ABIU09_05330 [Pyrinomonadaceae bacterium]